MILSLLQRSAEDYWMQPPIAKPTPWVEDDPTAGWRLCPGIRDVYQNGKELLRLILLIDVFVMVLWVTVAIWLAWLPENPKLAALIFNLTVLTIISVICFLATVKAVRGERVVIVSGAPGINGMHDNWPKMEPEDDQTNDPDQDVVPQAQPEPERDGEDEGSVFVFPDRENKLPPDDEREVG